MRYLYNWETISDGAVSWHRLLAWLSESASMIAPGATMEERRWNVLSYFSATVVPEVGADGELVAVTSDPEEMVIHLGAAVDHLGDTIVYGGALRGRAEG